MNNKEEIVQVLNKTLSGILAGSQQHFIHATINKMNGYNKISERMMEESTEEMRGAVKFINRILELGGKPNIEPEKWPIHEGIEDQLQVEYREQEEALNALNHMISSIESDDVTKKLLEDYLIDENNHTNWLKQQLNLIDSIGIANYLTTQV